MSVYNGESTVARSVESVLAQTGVDFEFIIANDGSKDGTAGILDGLCGTRCAGAGNPVLADRQPELILKHCRVYSLGDRSKIKSMLDELNSIPRQVR